MTEMNDRQTPVTDELLSMYPPEVGESLMEALNTIPYAVSYTHLTLPTKA